MAEPIADRPIAPASYGFPDTPDLRLPWSRTEQRLQEASLYWIATANAAAVPHTTPIWGVWVDGDY
jgi:hypothetical protein